MNEKYTWEKLPAGNEEKVIVRSAPTMLGVDSESFKIKLDKDWLQSNDVLSPSELLENKLNELETIIREAQVTSIFWDERKNDGAVWGNQAGSRLGTGESHQTGSLQPFKSRSRWFQAFDKTLRHTGRSKESGLRKAPCTIPVASDKRAVRVSKLFLKDIDL